MGSLLNGKTTCPSFHYWKSSRSFFRQAMKVTAIKNNATGWVRNLKDGRVEAVIEGEDLDVSNVVEWCHAGPANARVEDVEIRNERHKGEFAKFEVLY